MLVRVGVSERVCVGVSVIEGVLDSEPDILLEVVNDVVEVTVRVELSVGDIVSVQENEYTRVAVGDHVELIECVHVFDNDVLGNADGVIVVVKVPDGVMDGDVVAVGECVTVGVRDCVTVVDIVGLSELVSLCV